MGELVELGGQVGFKDSKVVGEKTAVGEASSSAVTTRVSRTAWCSEANCRNHPSLQRLQSKVHDLTGINVGNLEHVQFLSYKKGEFFERHLDADASASADAAGMRIMTIFLYLNDVPAGGETAFPHLGLRVSPRRGAALLWANVQDQDPGQVDPRTTHEAVPVQKGTKLA